MMGVGVLPAVCVEDGLLGLLLAVGFFLPLLRAIAATTPPPINTTTTRAMMTIKPGLLFWGGDIMGPPGGWRGGVPWPSWGGPLKPGGGPLKLGCCGGKP